MRLRKRITAMLAGTIGCMLAFSAPALAEEVDPGQKTVLTVHTVEDPAAKGDKGNAINGVKLHFYRVGTVNESGDYTLTDTFRGSGVDLSGLDLTESDANREAQVKFRHWIREKGIVEDASGTTADGKYEFDATGAQGVYYISADPIEGYFKDETVSGKKGELSYIPSPMLVSLPSPPDEDLKIRYWDYNPEAYVKYTRGGTWIDPPVLKILTIRKGSPGEETFKFVMESVNGAPLPTDEGWPETTTDRGRAMLEMKYSSKEAGTAKEFGTVWFNEEGTWQYLIYEEAGTNRNMTYDGTVYRITVKTEINDENRLTGTQTVETIRLGKVEARETRPTEQDRENPYQFENVFYKPGGGGNTPPGGNPPGKTPPTKPPVSEESVTPEITGALPKTGMLWWPVSVLAAAGGCMIVLGAVLEWRRKH